MKHPFFRRAGALVLAVVTLWAVAVTVGSQSLPEALHTLRSQSLPRQLVRWELGDLFPPQTLSLTTLLALLGARMVDRVNIAPVISGAIMPLLPGLAMTNAMRDTIRGDLVSGGARLGEAILSVMMLAAGIGLMLSMWGGGLL